MRVCFIPSNKVVEAMELTYAVDTSYGSSGLTLKSDGMKDVRAGQGYGEGSGIGG